MRSRGVFLGAFLLCAVAYSEPAFGLNPSGEVVAVVQSTSASGPGGSRTLSETLPVYSGDTIATGGIGQAQIRFADQTRLVVGPNSSVVIDRFVLASGGSAAGATMRFAKGAFRFITGTGPSSSYRLQTPTATIGIRGTELDITVGGRVGTAVVVFNGAVQVCNRNSGKCATVDRSCGAVVASPDGALSLPGSSRERATLIKTAFPLAQSQSSLRRDFRVDTTSCGGSTEGRETRDSSDVQTRAARAAPAPEPEPEEPGHPEEPGNPEEPGHHPEDPGKPGERQGRHGRHGKHGHEGQHGQHGQHGQQGQEGQPGQEATNEGRHGDGRNGRGRGRGRDGEDGSHGKGRGHDGSQSAGRGDGHGHGHGGRGGRGGHGHGDGNGNGRGGDGNGRGGDGNGSAGASGGDGNGRGGDGNGRGGDGNGRGGDGNGRGGGGGGGAGSGGAGSGGGGSGEGGGRG